jgi:hypothetical protein
MSDTINKSLGQLEEDLKKLQAAREQVESVVASNQEFAMAVNSLIENTNLLVDKIKTATEGAIGNFSEKLTESKNAVDIVVKDGVSHIQSSVKKIEETNLKLQDSIETKVNEVSELVCSAVDENVTQSLATIKESSSLAIKSLETQIQSSVKEIEEANLELQDTIVTKVNEVSQLASSAIDKNATQSLALVDKMKTVTESAMENFSKKLIESKNAVDKIVENNIKKVEETNLELQNTIKTKINEVSQLANNAIDKNVTQSLEAIEDISNLAIKSLETQQSENLKTLNQILETHIQIKQLIGQLLDLDLSNALKMLNSNIEKQQQQNDRQFQTMKQTQIWSLIGIGVVAVMIIIFKYVL